MQLISRLAVVASLTTSALIAQTNPFVVYPQDPERVPLTCTSFVGRPDMANQAEALMEIDAEHFRGVGATQSTIARLFGVYHWLADEKLSTSETYDLVVRAAAAGPGPDMSAGGELLRIAGLTSPPSANPQRGTWICSDGFGLTSGLVLSQPGRLYVGVDLPANPLWPATDGHSLFRADLLNAGTGAIFGENHRANIVNPTWAGKATPFSTPWTYVLGPMVTTPNLHIGGLDPTSNRLGAPGANFGMNGLFPDISGQPRLDGIKVRVTDNLAPFGIVLLAGQLGFTPVYFEQSLNGVLYGGSHIGNPTTPPVMLGFAALQNGQFEGTLAAPGALGPSQIGIDLALQAIVWDVPTNIAYWTNAQEVHL